VTLCGEQTVSRALYEEDKAMNKNYREVCLRKSSETGKRDGAEVIARGEHSSGSQKRPAATCHAEDNRA